ncbi:sensor histidine kinase [Asticcacaulis biprosthecium]|nr:ATP-binding protein [Asticcacaulis biprosthecium]
MRINLFNTPAGRLTTLMTLGLTALAIAVGWALQPATGPTLNLLSWRLFSINPALWVSLGTGFGAYAISTWIWALKPENPATRLFAASGVLTLLFTFSATRGFMAAPLPDSLMLALQSVNVLAASGFGIVMICLFLIYPSRLPGWRWGIVACVTVFGVWTLVRTFGPFRDLASVQPITLAEMVGIILIALWQIAFTRNEPRQRAIAVWLAASVVLGAGTFIALVSVPITLGHDAIVPPHYAFAAFLLIYAGLAVGLVRYRLFELGGWAFQLMFNATMALATLAIDAVFIGALSLTPGVAFGLSLFAVAFLYLPLRAYAWHRLTQRRAIDEAVIFRSVIATSLQPSGPQRAEGWRQLVQDLYRPLELVSAPTSVDTPKLQGEGLELHLPAAAGAPSLLLRYPHDGRSLFSPRDLAVAEQILALMHHAEESRGAYDRGVSEERTRIARDIHDNIGAQLLRALHSGAAERKDAMIRDTLADLRDVINNAQSVDLPLSLILADMRAETADRLSPHGISLAWRVDAPSERSLKPASIHALRSLVREATSNTIKHANAQTMTVTFHLDESGVSLLVEDDGRGFNLDTVQLGHGLDNMKSRAESLGGAFSLTSEGAGTRLAARIPFGQEALPS